MSYTTEKSNTLYTLNQIDQNILVGSILGDGNLALYGRSRNAYFREQGCSAQAEYRLWKYKMLRYLDLKYKEYKSHNKLYSCSNQLYTNLYNLFYISNKKTITENNIELLNHPIGLATLYMDDGTLVIDSAKRRNGTIHIFPRIALYTLCFSEDENIILQRHIAKLFNINFKLKRRKDGLNYILELNKKEEVLNFLDIVSPYIKEIPVMDYKININKRLDEKKQELLSYNRFSHITCVNLGNKNNLYTYEQEKMIISLLEKNVSQHEIAHILNHPYWGIVDKIRRMRRDGII